MSYRILLAKILPAEYAQEFVCGNLYLNTLSYFNAMEASNPARHDTDDGIHASRQFAQISIQDPKAQKWLPISDALSPLTIRTQQIESLNVLCLYMITDRSGDIFHSANLHFGDTAIVINDTKAFFQRIQRATSESRKTMEVSPIEYVDKITYSGLMGLFRKFLHFHYQNELRALLTGGTGKPCRLKVGDLGDITMLLPSIQIPHLWQDMRTNYT